jgi:predicted amidohydrolase YtcJ
MAPAVVFGNGRIFTGRRYVEALVVDDGRVVYAGPGGDASRHAPVGAERVDLEGAVAVPGLTDAHVHLGELARIDSGLDLGGVRERAVLRERLRAWAADRPGAIVGRGFELASLPASAWPDAAELDRALDDRPVVVYDASGHVALLNSRALERLANAPVPDGPVARGVRRDGAGRPTGVLVEEAARRLGAAVVERSPPSGAAIGGVIDRLVAFGITGVGAMSVGVEELAALQEWAASAQRPPAVRVFVRADRFMDSGSPPLPAPLPHLSVVGAKGFLDGAFGPRTAALLQPYDDLPATSGESTLDPPAAAALVAWAKARGLRTALHAIGDRAVVDAAAAFGPHDPTTPRGGRVEHASLLTPAAWDALLVSRPVLVVQPGFLLTDTWLVERLGRARARWAYAFRTGLDLGLSLAGSSDAPYGPVDPWAGIRAAVYRRDPVGGSANGLHSESLAVEEALNLYLASAAASVDLAGGGSLEVGGRADFAVLAAPSLGSALNARSPVRSTWIGGAKAYGPQGETARGPPRATV